MDSEDQGVSGRVVAHLVGAKSHPRRVLVEATQACRPPVSRTKQFFAIVLGMSGFVRLRW